MSTPPKIQLSGVKKAFGPKVVLAGIDYTLPAGESLVVIGGSGSGKSVLLKCILGLIRPDAGSIRIDGVETVGAKGQAREEVLKKIGMLFQGAALFDSMKVWQNVGFRLIEGQGMPRRQAKEIAIGKLAQVGLGADVAELYPSELSGGMQKRVSLARAIATDPEIIFFDEPTTGLDPIMADVINDLIVASVRKLGATTISITHDMASARKIATQVAMIYDGRFIWSGPVAEIDRTDNPYVAQFIHGSAEGPIKMAVRRP